MDTRRTPRALGVNPRALGVNPKALAEVGDVPDFSTAKLRCEQILDGWRYCTLLQVLIAATVLRHRSNPTVRQWAQLSKGLDRNPSWSSDVPK
jgi:hypothetical protein